jgi:hypothetical protein
MKNNNKEKLINDLSILLTQYSKLQSKSSNENLNFTYKKVDGILYLHEKDNKYSYPTYTTTLNELKEYLDYIVSNNNRSSITMKP